MTRPFSIPLIPFWLRCFIRNLFILSPLLLALIIPMVLRPPASGRSLLRLDALDALAPCSFRPNVLRPTYTRVRKFEDQFCMTSGPWFLISGLWHLEKSLVTSLPFSDLSSLIVFINSRTINSLDRSSNKK